MMKKVLLLASVGACFLVPSIANAASSLMVIGAGASSISGQVVVNARATAPATGSFVPVAPATGSIRVHSPVYGETSGAVTCIGVAGPNAAIVSGNLSTPFVSGGFTYPNFSLIVVSPNPVIRSWISFGAVNLSTLGPCGTSLFFTFGIPSLPNDFVVTGRFNVLGAG